MKKGDKYQLIIEIQKAGENPDELHTVKHVERPENLTYIEMHLMLAELEKTKLILVQQLNTIKPTYAIKKDNPISIK